MNMMLMSAYIPCGSNGQNSTAAAVGDSTKQQPPIPYPFGLYGGDLLPHPLIMPDLFYPVPLSNFYSHFGGLTNINSTEKSPSSINKRKSTDKLNFGIDAILNSEQLEKLDKNNESKCEDEIQNEKDPNKHNITINNNKIPTVVKSEKTISLETAADPLPRAPAFLQSTYPLGLPPIHPTLTSQYNFTPPHHTYGLFERRDGARTHCNPKRKRSWSRAVFSALQRKGLEKRFEVQKYVTKPDRRQLAAVLGLTDAQVKVWFQNRRMKWRHMEEQRKKREQEEHRHKHTSQKHHKSITATEVHTETKGIEEEQIHVTDSEFDSDIEA